MEFDSWGNLVRGIRKEISRQYTYAKCDVLALLPALPHLNSAEFNVLCTKTEQSGDELSQFIVNLLDYRFELRQLKPVEKAHRNLRLCRLSNNLGFYFLSRDVCNVTLGLVYNESSVDVKFMRSMGLAKARACRGVGEYNEAINIYGELLVNHKENEELSKARFLLYMGKTAHNHLWRAGFYKFLTKFATKRLQNLDSCGDDTVEHLRRKYLAICLDSQAMIEYEVASYYTNSRNEEKLLQEINLQWTKAIELMSSIDGGNSILRMKMRRAFANFQCLRAEARTIHLISFRDALDELVMYPNDKRGLAVRYGQYAEILTSLEDFCSAKEYLRRALVFSEKYADWRTLANNQLRYARLLLQTNASVDEVAMSLNVALDKLKNIEQPHPDIEFNIYMEFAKLYQQNSDYTKGLSYLEHASDILVELEERLINDHEVLTAVNGYEKSGFAVLTMGNILSKEELLELQSALVIDYRLLSALQRQVLADIDRLRPASTRHLLMKSQLKFMAEGHILQRHRVKNSITDWKDNLLDKLYILEKKSDGDFGKELREIIFEATETGHVMEKAVASLTSEKPVEGTPFTSVNDTLRNISNLTYLKHYDPHLVVKCDFDESNDFEIECYPSNLENALYNLVENAAQLFKRSNLTSNHIVWLRSRWVDSSDISDCKGCIEIEDNAGKYEEFKNKWHSMLYERNGGLKYTNTFFRRFDGQLELSQKVNGNTVISIVIYGVGFVRKKVSE